MKKTLAIVLITALACLSVFAGGNQELATPASTTTTTTTTTTTAAPAAAEETKKLSDLYAEGTVLRMATGYNSKKTGIAFDADTAGDGVELAGVIYHSGDLKPTWVAVGNLLGIEFEDKYQGNSASKELQYWAERLDEVDFVSGNAASLNEYGVKGSLVNIAEYLDLMPNFKAYLEIGRASCRERV